MDTLHEVYKALRESLSESDSRYVIQKRCNASRIDLIANPDKAVGEAERKAIQEDLAQYQAGKPLSRIYGSREFWGLDFALSEGTLDPRPDTETLIDAVLARLGDTPPATILDLGTGTGCILTALLSEFSEAQGVGIDLSPSAAQTARGNAHANGVGARANFVCGSWGQAVNHKFDLVVSNPPYISNQIIPTLDENVQKFDPILALDGGDDGLQAYKDIFSQLSSLLKRGGYGFFEIGYDQEKTVTRLSEESRFTVMGVHRDSAGHPRVVEIFFE
jgi:release factor glutamine methyltransferase